MTIPNKISASDFRAMQGKKRNQKKEESLQIQIATYLRLKHKEIIFRSDVAAGIKLTMGQAIKAKRMQHGRAYPDLFICEPRNSYSGLYLELKKDRSEVYLKSGAMSQDKHVLEQAAMLEELRQRGYCAEFACGFSNAVDIIEDYLKITQHETRTNTV